MFFTPLLDFAGSELGAVLPQLVKQGFDHVVARLGATGRGLKVDGEGVYIVLVFA